MNRRGITFTLAGVLAAGFLIGALAGDSRLELDPAVNERLHWYLENGFGEAGAGLSKMIEDLLAIQVDSVVLVPPSEPAMVFTGGLRYALWAGFPKRFVAGLVGELQNGVTVYPVLCFQDRKTAAYCFVNAAGKVFYTVAAPADYDPNWILLSRFPDFYSVERTPWEVEDMEELCDPCRVMCQYTLAGKAELQALVTDSVAKESTSKVSQDGAVLMESMMMGGGSGGASITNLGFTGMTVVATS